ncbi:Protein of unknown function [Nannocystis exedens]|uniref:DUF1554 domain-containing protein n=1 Tax=Nannocystis exedens TaxID=54 RepID=A0A1I2GJC3_9BACT|nr:Protein of unknown function [Nannocystis exedens]
MTNAKFTGNLGGLSGADEECALAADAVKLPNAGSFKAWLSNGSNWPAKRLDTAYSGMYVLTDGTVVAENGWADLTDGELLHPVDLSETKMKVNAAPWTNTKADGTSVGASHCESWTEEMMPQIVGAFGSTNATDARWTDAMGTSSCTGEFPLYCIEDL